MAYKLSDEQWNTDISEAFTIQEGAQIEGEEEIINDIISAFKSYKKKLTKQVKIKWEHQSLTNYLKLDIIPRGLRIRLDPGINLRGYDANTEFLAKWNEILTKCSLELIALMIAEDAKKLEVCKKEVETIYDCLTKYEIDSSFEKLNKEVQKQIEKLQSELKHRKRRKLIRDQEDYRKDRIYIYRNRFSTRNFYDSGTDNSDFDSDGEKSNLNSNTASHIPLGVGQDGEGGEGIRRPQHDRRGGHRGNRRHQEQYMMTRNRLRYN